MSSAARIRNEHDVRNVVSYLTSVTLLMKHLSEDAVSNFDGISFIIFFNALTNELVVIVHDSDDNSPITRTGSATLPLSIKLIPIATIGGITGPLVFLVQDKAVNKNDFVVYKVPPRIYMKNFVCRIDQNHEDI